MVISVADKCDINRAFLQAATGLIAQYVFDVAHTVGLASRRDVVQKFLIDVDCVQLGNLGGDHSREQTGSCANVGDRHRGPQLTSVYDFFSKVEDLPTFALKPFDKPGQLFC